MGLFRYRDHRLFTVRVDTSIRAAISLHRSGVSLRPQHFAASERTALHLLALVSCSGSTLSTSRSSPSFVCDRIGRRSIALVHEYSDVSTNLNWIFSCECTPTIFTTLPSNNANSPALMTKSGGGLLTRVAPAIAASPERRQQVPIPLDDGVEKWEPELNRGSTDLSEWLGLLPEPFFVLAGEPVTSAHALLARH